MSNITATLVRDLREKTGAGMMDCKQALVETGGDLELAVDWLRKKGHAAAAKKAGRATAEGMVGLSVHGKSGVVVELNSETDFVARNEKFQTLMSSVLKAAQNCNSLSDLEMADYDGSSQTVKEAVTENVSIIGENISLSRFAKVSVNNGVVASYVHNAIMDNAGKIAVLVALESNIDHAALNGLGKQLAMHIAAARPEVLSREMVSDAQISREKEIFAEQARASGKSDEIIEKMLVGRLQKFYQEIVLLEQVFIMDNKTKIADLLKEFGKQHGGEAIIKDFVRYELGQHSSN